MYLKAAVSVVLVIDPSAEIVHGIRHRQSPEIDHAADYLTLPEIRGDFRVAVKEFFA